MIVSSSTSICQFQVSTGGMLASVAADFTITVIMLEDINRYEQIARQLELAPDEREAVTKSVFSFAEYFLTALENDPAYQISPDSAYETIPDLIIEEPGNLSDTLDKLQGKVVEPGLNPASGRFFGYIPGGGLYYSALGDYLAAVTNRYSGVHFASPGAVQLENSLIHWMADTVGYPESAGGTLTSGGSIANLSAIIAARDACGIEGNSINSAVIYTTAHAHHSVDKAIHLAGLRKCIRRIIDVDSHFRLDANHLAAVIEKDKQSGLFPWLIIASAGTTNTGSVDPLADIADISENHNLWYHVDGAYGAFFILCEQGRRTLSGIERSHSLVMDPHKTLFLPYGTGAILVRDQQYLLDVNRASADYMQDTVQEDFIVSPADVSPELTRHFRGLRVWLPLRMHGLAVFRAALAEKMLLAQYAYSRLDAMSGFEVGPFPDLAVTIFRYLPSKGDANEFNKDLVTRLQSQGRVFLSSTTIDGVFWLRIAVGAFRSHLKDVEEALDLLEQTAQQISDGTVATNTHLSRTGKQG